MKENFPHMNLPLVNISNYNGINNYGYNSLVGNTTYLEDTDFHTNAYLKHISALTKYLH